MLLQFANIRIFFRKPVELFAASGVQHEGMFRFFPDILHQKNLLPKTLTPFTMRYSINDLEKLTGIKAHTLRIWEKRYAIISPRRTDTNIRYYDNEDLKQLLNISTLNRHGFKISRIAKMSGEEIRDKVMEISASSADYDSQINKLVVAMIDLNEAGFEQTLGNSILKIGFEKTVTHVLYPLLEKIGILWQIGTINPAQEHFLTNLIRQKMIIAIDGQQQTTSEKAKTFLLFLPENELHELGLLFYHYLIKKNGFKSIYLGQSVPFNDLVEVTRIRHADYLFTYFVAAMNHKQAARYIEQLSAAFPKKTIFVTGLQLQDSAEGLPANAVLVKNAEEFKQQLNIG